MLDDYFPPKFYYAASSWRGVVTLGVMGDVYVWVFSGSARREGHSLYQLKHKGNRQDFFLRHIPRSGGSCILPPCESFAYSIGLSFSLGPKQDSCFGLGRD
ncbi:hypothetical protein AVEN_82063-1 [Araneus ventricosus]|uniref:Uncharacterized protein n=1 Tax=Araneus ventricosus TaxID=182803 RepID=A0A4Y2U6X4_ARAVE|nr:hypothetical protein AVEN_82063-1 [Araneus ventricosus]